MFYGDWLHRRELLSPNKVALIDAVNNNQSITYREWNQRANRLANFLREVFGVGKGDRVSIYSMNRVEYLDALFACNKLGAVLQVIYWRLKTRELEGIINDVEPEVLIYSQEWSKQVEELRLELKSVENYLGLDQAVNDKDVYWLSERERWPDTQPPPVELDWEDPWFICYTGGTAGISKGAVLHYRSVTWNSVNTVVSWGIRPDDVVPQFMPMFHTGGLNVLTIPLIHVGATSIICPGFDIDRFFDQIDSLGVTFFFAVPTMFLMMIQHPRWEEVDLSGVRLVMAGGGNCPKVVYEAFWEKGVEFKEGYGLTEAGPNTFWLPGEEVKGKIGSVGRPLFHIDVKIMDDEGKTLGVNEIGHLLIRGPHVFGGYWNKPKETAEVIVDGWLRTGDLARVDEDGCYYIVGRSKAMIRSGGENIYPAEVEDVMHSHVDVADAALIPVPDPKWGEVGRAIVMLKPGSNLSEEDLTSWIRDQMAHFKVPKLIVFVDQLPKTAANKTDKKILIDLYG